MAHYAIAIDLGSTTLAAALVECSTGVRLASCGALNPQRRFGADVISRLEAAVTSPVQREEMTAAIRAELRRLASELCATAGILWSEIRQVAIAGNPAMQHLLLGLEVKSLAFPPYRPLYTGGTRGTVAMLGWEGGAALYVFPMPGGFVGGDTVAFVAAVETEPGGATLCLDLGTNGEIALCTGDTIRATSAAAGPAFEGGNLSCGMAALPGAISSVRIEDGRIVLQTIGGGQPLGICGSAALEALCELLRCGIVEAGGRLRSAAEVDSNLATRLVEHEGASALVLYCDARRRILLTQQDIRQVQLAKAAIRAGIDLLCENAGVQCHELQEVVLTGSFGAVVRFDWLKSLGIFAGSMVQTTRFTPEGALAGVEKALYAADDFAAVEQLAQRFRMLPLSGTPRFEALFMQHIDFPQV